MVRSRSYENQLQQDFSRQKKLIENRQQEELVQIKRNIEREKEELQNKLK